ncbi:hypothetical protein PISMIDRAFT_527171 [Pisolithus microcarpus 441]|uniref:Uncharacterized protein n=1 Tax=Pisolithus microcarpus 441 TaxID=765257 RepID=A0A0C9Z7J3_9AGAM|nr:hypothetical protein BKA83DRAFT_527171 [Pisolithus microcarpus]KIK21959.1 hypothetical protein PISMIDRAFT_527171 [Pisolithus microcarpus 441]
MWVGKCKCNDRRAKVITSHLNPTSTDNEAYCGIWRNGLHMIPNALYNLENVLRVKSCLLFCLTMTHGEKNPTRGTRESNMPRLPLRLYFLFTRSNPHLILIEERNALQSTDGSTPSSISTGTARASRKPTWRPCTLLATPEVTGPRYHDSACILVYANFCF